MPDDIPDDIVANRRYAGAPIGGDPAPEPPPAGAAEPGAPEPGAPDPEAGESGTPDPGPAEATAVTVPAGPLEDGAHVAAPPAERAALLQRVLAGTVVAVVLAVAVAALAVVLALTMLQLGDKNAVDGARTSALSTGRVYAADLAGYDYRHLDQDFGVVLSHSTPSFRRSFTQSSDALKATLERFHATANAKVVAAGVVSATTDRAVVLVFIDQTVTNSAQKTPTTDRSQVEITLLWVNGSWLIDQVSLL
jgi:Mce-associated membrane protein